MLSQRLNRRITIQEATTGQDAIGQPVNTWSDVATVWAAINDLSGREYLAADAAQNAVTTKITIRHLDGLAPAMRVIAGEDEYDVEAVLGTDRRTLMLMCVRGA